MRRVVQAGEPESEEIIDAFILPLVERAVPDWRSALAVFP